MRKVVNRLKNRPSHLLWNQGAEDFCGCVTVLLEPEEGTETTDKVDEWQRNSTLRQDS